MQKPYKFITNRTINKSRRRRLSVKDRAGKAAAVFLWIFIELRGVL